MNGAPMAHLSPDDIDAWLAGALPETAHAHLYSCAHCQEFARLERAVVDHLALLPPLSPRADFPERVMAAVFVPDPFKLRALATLRRRVAASPRAVGIAALLAITILGAMSGSVLWSMTHRETLTALGQWLMSEGSTLLWAGVRTAASGVVEQPWYTDARRLFASPSRSALALAVASLIYLTGVLALRRLLALPAQRVAGVEA